jgi:hypothetical protein
MGFPQKTKIELPCDPAIQLLGICLKESKSGYNEVHLHTHGYCSHFHDSEATEIAQRSYNW